MWKLVHLQQLVQSTEVGVASRREWSTPSNTRGDSAVPQQEQEEEEEGGGVSWTNHIAAASQSQSCCCLVQSGHRVLHFPAPSTSSSQETPPLVFAVSAIVSRTGGEGLVGIKGRSQQDCPSYLVEEVSGRSLLCSSPALHHLDGLRYHTHRGGEGHQEQQVWKEGGGRRTTRKRGRRKRRW